MQDADMYKVPTTEKEDSEVTTTASELNAKSMLTEMLRRAGPKKGKHNLARSLRAKAKQRKRKAKRK